MYCDSSVLTVEAAIAWHPIGGDEIGVSDTGVTGYSAAVAECEAVGATVWIRNDTLGSQVAPLLARGLAYYTRQTPGTVCRVTTIYHSILVKSRDI